MGLYNNYTGKSIPRLGFGLMRLPTIGKDIDMEQTIDMVDAFLENGFTYFDTAHGYHGGKSELAAGEALVRRHPREAFQLATKLSMWDMHNKRHMQQMFDTSLERTKAGFFDYYLLHNINTGLLKKANELGAWEFCQNLKRKGLIKHLGFSFHDKADLLDQILTEHPEMDFVQLQINYADWEDEEVQSRLCYETARKHNKPIIVMEPVKGGSLANLKPEIQAMLKAANPDMSIASWAIRYAASLEGVALVLSGMSNMEQMNDNISYMKNFNPLQDTELITLKKAMAELRGIPIIPCTTCGYCLKDCPQSINIPGIFSVYNEYLQYGNLEGVIPDYQAATSDGGKASDCIACGNCEGMCPQHIKIIEWMEKIALSLE